MLLCDDIFCVPIDGCFSMRPAHRLDLSVHHYRLLRPISYAVVGPLPELRDEVIFDTGDECTRTLFVHNGATLYMIADSTGEMQTAALARPE